MNIPTHSSLLDRVEDKGQMNTAFFVRKQNIPYFRPFFSEQGNSSGYYLILPLVYMHCGSWFTYSDARSPANSG